MEESEEEKPIEVIEEVVDQGNKKKKKKKGKDKEQIPLETE